MSETFSMILGLLTGIAMFLFGMSSMSEGLKKVAGNKMELILYRLTNSPLKGFLLGAAVTCVIQSSSATTVMVVGFVNSGMMKFVQAIGVILGANIGTSITGWIVSLSYVEGAGWTSVFSSSTIVAVLATIGTLWHMFAKKDVLKQSGNILLGLAVLMTGMSMMSNAVEPLQTNPAFLEFMQHMNNPFLAIFIGILVALVLQSSSAAVGVVQALSVTGAVKFSGAFPIIMGIAIGAYFPVGLAAIGANKDGKRTSLVYLVVSVIAAILGICIYYPIELATHLVIADQIMDPFSIALVNTVYRLVTMTVLLPFVKQIKQLCYVLIKRSDEEKEDRDDFDKLEERLLANPRLAYEAAMDVMSGMALKAQKNVLRAVSLLENYDQKKYDKIKSVEHSLNRYEDKLGKYLVKLTGRNISVEQGQNISKALQAIGDFEDIGDYASRIADNAKQVYTNKEKFTEAATDELAVISAATEEAVEITVQSFIEDDPRYVKRVFPLKELVSIDAFDIKKNHIARLAQGECSMEMGFMQADIIANMQHVVDHCAAIALDIVKSDEKNFNVHRFLRKYQEENKNEYTQLLKDYEIKYSIHEETPDGNRAAQPAA